jgi:uncharacterized protein (TIGR02996 family)
MSDEEAFLAVLKANPADETARLVYADWLDESGAAPKAQYLRAVVELTQLPGGSAEYTDAAGRLYTACVQIDLYWRRAAGARFDVVIEGFGSDKILLIKIIRELTGFGLAEAKAMAESVPTPLFSWLPFEEALPRLLAFNVRSFHGDSRPFAASIRPTAWPDSAAQGAVFDVVLTAHHINTGLDHYWGHYAVNGVAALLGVTSDEAHDRLNNLPLTLAAGLQPAAVADFVRRLKLMFNVGTALPPGAIRVVPRIPTS